MTTPEIERRPAALWKAMTDAQRQAAAEAFWADDESVAEQTEVMLLLSRKLNFRYKSVEAMAPERKTTHLLKLAQVSEGVAARLLVTYHLATQRPMMGAFLDGLGIKHEDGLIDTDDVPKPDAATLETAAKAIVAAHPAEDVRLYFTTLLMQDPGDLGRPRASSCRPRRHARAEARPPPSVLAERRRDVAAPGPPRRHQAGERGDPPKATAAPPSAAGSVADTSNSSAWSRRPTSSAPGDAAGHADGDQPGALAEDQPMTWWRRAPIACRSASSFVRAPTDSESTP